VGITNPADNATFTAPASITVSASATDFNGIAQVQFFANGSSIGVDTTEPYDIVWTNVAAGTYSLTAIATDNDGLSTTSAVVTIIINGPPTVSLTSPQNNATFTPPATIALAAQASDTDGTVTSVEFYQGTTLIATVSAAPYTYDWTNVPPGDYVLTAKATDDRGATTTSAPVNVSVGATQAQLHYIHADHLNTPRLVADATGTTVWRWDQAEPFGNNPADEDPDANSVAFDLPLRLPGQRYDAETGLHYNYYRDYDPLVGRYIQSDPIGLAGGLNSFIYGKADALRHVDLVGLAATLCVDCPPQTGEWDERQGVTRGYPWKEWECEYSCTLEGACKGCPNEIAGMGYGDTRFEAATNARRSAMAALPKTCLDPRLACSPADCRQRTIMERLPPYPMYVPPQL
jgi:RHS repeat-associated protein